MPTLKRLELHSYVISGFKNLYQAPKLHHEELRELTIHYPIHARLFKWICGACQNLRTIKFYCGGDGVFKKDWISSIFSGLPQTESSTAQTADGPLQRIYFKLCFYGLDMDLISFLNTCLSLPTFPSVRYLHCQLIKDSCIHEPFKLSPYLNPLFEKCPTLREVKVHFRNRILDYAHPIDVESTLRSIRPSPEILSHQWFTIRL